MIGETTTTARGTGVDALTLRVTLLVGLAVVAVFHAGGAIDASDALGAAGLREGPAGSRALALGVDLLRLIDVRIGLFRAAHLTAGFLLAVAAALSAATAARLAGGAVAGLTAGLLAGGIVLFGGESGRFGMEAGPVAPLLAALAGAAWAWTGTRPRPGTGAFLLGAAVAVHPAALLALPGFAVLARGLPSGSGPRAALGFVAGLALLHLPPEGGAWGGAIGAWWRPGGTAWWRPAGPGDWPAGVREAAAALWRGTGPLALPTGLAGVALAARSRGAGAATSRAWIPTLALTFLAIVAGARPDPTLAAAAAWSMGLLAAPTIGAITARLGGVATLLPGAAIAGAGALVLGNLSGLDRSAERGVEWAMDSVAQMREGALLLTRNPVHAALSRDGVRPDVEVRYLPPSSPPGETRELLREIATQRRVYLDASLFFDIRWRTAAIGDEYQMIPSGLVFQALAKGRRLRELDPVDWIAMHQETDYPPSPLRDGLGTRDFYARSLLQAAFQHIELGYDTEAEHELVYALSYEPSNRTLAALGMARIFLERRQPGSAVTTLETFVRTEDEGAWNALRVLGSAYAQLRRPEDAIRAYRRALPLVPAQMSGERESIERAIAGLEQQRAGSGG